MDRAARAARPEERIRGVVDEDDDFATPAEEEEEEEDPFVVFDAWPPVELLIVVGVSATARVHEARRAAPTPYNISGQHTVSVTSRRCATSRSAAAEAWALCRRRAMWRRRPRHEEGRFPYDVAVRKVLTRLRSAAASAADTEDIDDDRSVDDDEEEAEEEEEEEEIPVRRVRPVEEATCDAPSERRSMLPPPVIGARSVMYR